jgi:hypothetical protein
LNACVDHLPHTYSCTCLFKQKETKVETNKGFADLNTEKPISSYYFIIIITIILLYFIFKVLTYLLFNNSSKAKVKDAL